MTAMVRLRPLHIKMPRLYAYLQNTDRVSHRSAADMELRSQFLLDDAGARRQGT
jgi:hypothetical protein